MIFTSIVSFDWFNHAFKKKNLILWKSAKSTQRCQHLLSINAASSWRRVMMLGQTQNLIFTELAVSTTQLNFDWAKTTTLLKLDPIVFSAIWKNIFGLKSVARGRCLMKTTHFESLVKYPLRNKVYMR